MSAREEIRKLLGAKRGKDSLIRVRALELSEALAKEIKKRDEQPKTAYLQAIADILTETLTFEDPEGNTAIQRKILKMDKKNPLLPGVQWEKARERTRSEKAIRQQRANEVDERQQSLKDRGKGHDVLLTGDL